MNIVNCTTRLPTKAGSYQVIVRNTDTESHRGIEAGVTWALEGKVWQGPINANEVVVAWADPNKEVVAPKLAPAAVVAEDLSNSEVSLTGIAVPASKIALIKTIREILNLPLGDAKAFVETATEAAPKTVLSNLSIPNADLLKTRLETAGGAVKVTQVVE